MNYREEEIKIVAENINRKVIHKNFGVFVGVYEF